MGVKVGVGMEPDIPRMGLGDRGVGSRLGGGVRIQEGWIHASAHLRPASAGMTGGGRGADEGG